MNCAATPNFSQDSCARMPCCWLFTGIPFPIEEFGALLSHKGSSEGGGYDCLCLFIRCLWCFGLLWSYNKRRAINRSLEKTIFGAYSTARPYYRYCAGAWHGSTDISLTDVFGMTRQLHPLFGFEPGDPVTRIGRQRLYQLSYQSGLLCYEVLRSKFLATCVAFIDKTAT